MQNYEPAFVKKVAKAIYKDMEERWRSREIWNIFVTEECLKKRPQRNKRSHLKTSSWLKIHGKKTLQVVEKLHRQLGHPGRERMVQSLLDAGFDDEIVKCARNYKCDVCTDHSLQKLEKPASLPQTSHFNELLESDAFT